MSKGLQHIRGSFPCGSDPEPVVLPHLITIVPTDDNLTLEALEIVKSFVVWGVLNRILDSKLLERKVGEVVDSV